MENSTARIGNTRTSTHTDTIYTSKVKLYTHYDDRPGSPLPENPVSKTWRTDHKGLMFLYPSVTGQGRGRGPGGGRDGDEEESLPPNRPLLFIILPNTTSHGRRDPDRNPDHPPDREDRNDRLSRDSLPLTQPLQQFPGLLLLPPEFRQLGLLSVDGRGPDLSYLRLGIFEM